LAVGSLSASRRIAERRLRLAMRRYRELSALSSDTRKDKYGNGIDAMVLRALTEIRPYGVPTDLQGFVEWKPDGLRCPIVGYYDFAWSDHGIVVDLKTTEALPSKIKTGHARQVALYAMSDNMDARLTYVTPIKSATYQLENIRQHRDALHQIAIRVEKFLSLSDDPEFFLSITAPDCESFYWSPPEARQAAFKHWRI
jgi:hypothetical protein